MSVRSTGFLLTQLAIRAVWQADTEPLEVCACVCACALGQGRRCSVGWYYPGCSRWGRGGYRGMEALCGARKHTCDPLLARSRTQTHTLSPQPLRWSTLIHTLINRLILAAAALYTPLNATHGNQWSQHVALCVSVCDVLEASAAFVRAALHVSNKQRVAKHSRKLYVQIFTFLI